MIEVNLLPGGKKGRSRSFKFKMPGIGGGALPDGYMLWCIVAGIVAAGYMGYAYMGERSTAEDLQVRLTAALQDSARFSDQIARASELRARGDSIALRVAIIQEIDVGRYVWAHVLDEIARAVPEYTWIREVLYSGDNPLQIRINGRAGSIPAITAYMANLEASPFFRRVDPELMQQAPDETSPSDVVYVFELVATYESPPLSELEAVPLFDEQSAVAQEAVPDSTGGI